MMPDDPCPNCVTGVLEEDMQTMELVCDTCGYVSEDEPDLDQEFPMDDDYMFEL